MCREHGSQTRRGSFKLLWEVTVPRVHLPLLDLSVLGYCSPIVTIALSFRLDTQRSFSYLNFESRILLGFEVPSQAPGGLRANVVRLVELQRKYSGFKADTSSYRINEQGITSFRKNI